MGVINLASKTQPEARSWHNIIYVIKWFIEIYKTRRKFRNICCVSLGYHVFEFSHKKDKLCKYADKNGISTVPMHFNDNKNGK